jgi:hypothetical protein
MRRGWVPLTIRWATRGVNVLVFPDPAPAMASRGDRVAVVLQHRVFGCLSLLNIVGLRRRVTGGPFSPAPRFISEMAVAPPVFRRQNFLPLPFCGF